jgi:hypothetical protein
MRQENYLYFANAGQNDTAKDAVMYPASNFRGAVTIGPTETELFFAPRDGTGTVADGVALTHADVAVNNVDGNTYESKQHFAVLEKFCQLASGNRVNTNNFTVVKDLNTNLPANEGAISSTGLTEVTAITITTH